MSTVPLPLTGKTALITGSSAGIGAAIALHLSSQGAKVVINYASSRDAADALVQRIGADRALAVRADAGNVREIERLVGETLAWGDGKIDILVANAADGAVGMGLEEVGEEEFDRVVGLNVKGVLFLVKKAAPHMPPSSHILLVSTSLTATSQIMPNYLLYVITKGAVEQMTRVLAKDLGRKGILVNAIAPGPTATALFMEGKSEQLVETIKSWNPFNRLGEVEDVARTVGFLVGTENTWVTGQVVRCNGGMAV